MHSFAAINDRTKISYGFFRTDIIVKFVRIKINYGHKTDFKAQSRDY